MQEDLAETLFDEATIHARLDVLAAELTAHYRRRDLTVVAVLNGSLLFAADLLRRIDLPLQIESIRAASYHGGTASSGTVSLPATPLPDLRGRHVLVLDDILDTGRTLGAICRRLEEESRPLSTQVCVLLRKRKLRDVEVEARYAGFEVGDEFVVGYGLDYRERYRNLPFIATLRGELIGV